MTYRSKFWLLAALAFGSAALFGVALGMVIPSSGGVEDPSLILPLALGAAGVVLFITWLWWRKTDDLQQQGQLISWWWGGTIGAVIMIVTLVVLTGRHSELSMGAGYLIGAQFFGMAMVWLLWKLRGRGAAE